MPEKGEVVADPALDRGRLEQGAVVGGVERQPVGRLAEADGELEGRVSLRGRREDAAQLSPEIEGLGPALEVELHLRQRRTCGVVRPVEMTQQPTERAIGMGSRFGQGRGGAGEMGGEGLCGIEPGPQRQEVGTVTDEPGLAQARLPRHRHADDEIVLAGEPREQHLEGREQRGGQGLPLPRRECFHGGDQRRRQGRAPGVADKTAQLRSRPVGRQVERLGRAGIEVGPVAQRPVRLRLWGDGAIDLGNRRQLIQAGAIGMSDLVGQDREGPAVAGDMVGRENEDVTPLAEAKKVGPRHRAGDGIERQAGQPVELSGECGLRLHLAREIGGAHRYGPGGIDPHRFAARGEAAAQGAVPAEHGAQGGQKALRVEGAVDPQGDDLGHRGVGLGAELCGQPDLGLAVGERPRLFAIRPRRSRGRFHRCPRPGQVHSRGHAGSGERAKLLLHDPAHGIELVPEDLLQFLRRHRRGGRGRSALLLGNGHGARGCDRLENSLAVDAGHPDPRLAVRLVGDGRGGGYSIRRASLTGRPPRRRIPAGRSAIGRPMRHTCRRIVSRSVIASPGVWRPLSRPVSFKPPEDVAATIAARRGRSSASLGVVLLLYPRVITPGQAGARCGKFLQRRVRWRL